MGLKGVQEKVRERRSRLELTDWEDLHKDQFLKSVEIAFVALSDQVLAYAALARELAATA